MTFMTLQSELADRRCEGFAIDFDCCLEKEVDRAGLGRGSAGGEGGKRVLERVAGGVGGVGAPLAGSGGVGGIGMAPGPLV